MPQSVESILENAKRQEGKKTMPPQDNAGADALTDVKRQQEVSDRPGKSAPVPVPPELHEFSNTSYKMAAPKSAPAKPKSEMEKSLDWNAQQRKAAEDATK